MESKKIVAVGLLITLGMLVPGVYEDITSTKYEQCRVGNDYGSWKVTNIKYIFRCNLTNDEQICWKTTKTRCYLFNMEKIKELEQNQTETIPINIRSICDIEKCVYV